MSSTKLKTVEWWWSSRTNELTQAGSDLGGRRVITGMLTGSSEPLDAAVAAERGTSAEAGTQK